MDRQWANSYILIIFDAGAFLMRMLQTQTRVRNFLVLVSHAFFGTHISGLHCNFCRQQVYQELHGQREEKNQIYQYLEASCIIINYNNYINTSILTQG